jgi:hypothetical protein
MQTSHTTPGRAPDGGGTYNVPFVLAGGGGSWAKGRYLSYGRDKTNPHNGLLVSVLNQFGMNVSTFGDPAFSGELQGL